MTPASLLVTVAAVALCYLVVALAGRKPSKEE